MRILGIDPGYAIVGFGLIDSQPGRQQLVACGAINTPAGVRLPARLWQIATDLEELIGQFHPDDETTLTVMAFRSSDPKLLEHLEVARRFFSNDITAAAGLYYLGYDTNYISEQQEQRLLSGLGAYALCVAELQLKGVPA